MRSGGYRARILKMGRDKLFKIVAALLVGLAGYNLFHPVVGARVVLAFVAPTGQPRTLARSEEPDRELASWASPCDMARLLLESPGMTDGVCRYLEGQPDPERQKGLRGAFALLDEHRLQVQPLGPSRLQCEVLDPEAKMARVYCRALLDYLERALQEERLTREVNSQLESDLLQSHEQLAAQEGRLTGAVDEKNSTDLAMQYAVGHYQDALAARKQLLEREQRWKASIEGNTPEFVVISGPSSFRRSPGPGLWGPLGLALLLLGMAQILRPTK